MQTDRDEHRNTERIEYKVISLPHFTIPSPRQLFMIQIIRSTRSSSTLKLLRPSVISSLKFDNSHSCPPLQNNLPPILQQIIYYDIHPSINPWAQRPLVSNVPSLPH